MVDEDELTNINQRKKMKRQLEDKIESSKRAIRNKKRLQYSIKMNKEIIMEYLMPKPNARKERIEAKKNLTKLWFKELESFREAEIKHSENRNNGTSNMTTLNELFNAEEGMWQYEEQLLAKELEYLAMCRHLQQINSYNYQNIYKNSPIGLNDKVTTIFQTMLW